MLIGAALLVLAFGGRLASNMRRNPRRWVRGTGHVVEATGPPPVDSRYGRSAIRLVVDAPDLPQDTVTIHDSRVPVAHWPQPGQELPIQVAADDSRHVRVLWRSLVAAQAGDEPGWGADPAGLADLADLADPADLADLADLADPAGLADPADQDAGPGGPGQPSELGAGPPEPDLPDDQIDFDLDGPPTIPLVPVPAAESGAVPRPRPSPRPRRRGPVPVAAGAVAAPAADRATDQAGTGTETGTETGTGTGTGSAGAGQVSELVTTYPSAHPGPAGAINGVGVTVLVSDLDQSVAFYRDRLGFYEVDGGEGSSVLASGETRLVLRQAADLGAVTRRLVHLNLEVADIDAMYAELKAAGIRFLYPPRPASRSARLELWAAAFRDPDGHGIALTQWRPRSTT
jgi:catechol 2,3-dioxygenase-like lactoylglutathione lyase family enzyme